MLSVRDYVYSIENGLGIIVEVKGTSYVVSYDGLEETVDQKDVSEVSNEIVEQVKGNTFRDYFSQSTLKKGSDYSDEGRVSSYYVSDRNLSGTVDGSDTYNVTMTFNKNSFRSRCTCPVGAFCKHSVAVLFTVSDEMKKLERKLKGTQNQPEVAKAPERKRESYSITPDVEALIRRLDDTKNQYADMDLEAFILLGEMIKSKRGPFMEALIAYMDTYYKNKRYYFTALKRLFIVDSHIGEVFDSLAPEYRYGVYGKEISRTFKHDRDSLLNLITNGANRYIDPHLTMCYFAMNECYLDAVQYVLQRGFTSEMKHYLPVLFTHCRPDSNIIDTYVSVIKRLGDIPEASSALMKHLDEGEKRELISKCPLIHLDLDEIRKLPFDQQMDVLALHASSEEEKTYILNKYYTFCQFDSIKAIRLILCLAIKYPRYQRNVIELLKNTKNTEAVLQFLQGKLTKDSNLDMLFQYLGFSYKIEDMHVDYEVTYQLLCNDLVLATVFRNGEGYYSNTIDDTLNIVEQILVNRVEGTVQFQVEFNRVSTEIFKRNEERIRNELSRTISSFAGELSISNNILLNDAHKMHIEPTIYSMSIRYEDKYYISFRVGNEKLYVVKDVFEFFDAVRDSVTVKYGKGLEFCHRIDNFDEYSRKILNFFLSLPYASFERDMKKGLELSTLTLTAFFEAMKGEYILLGSDNTLLRLETVEPVIHIDKNYNLLASFNNLKLIDLDTLYLLNPQTHVIDKVNGSRDEIKFYRFAFLNNGMNVSLVKQQFIDSIYCRFFNQIEVADEVKNDFKLSDLVINAYFDFDSRQITLKTELEKNGIPLMEKDISQATDIARLSYYTDFIKSLGFEDDRIIDEENIYSFFTMDFTELRNICNVFLSDSITNKSIVKMDNPVVRIQYNNNMMEMFMEESPYSEDELYQILQAVRKKKKYVLLKGDRIVDINNQEAKDLLDTVDDLGMDEKHLYTVTEAPLYQSLKAYAHMSNVSLDEYVKHMMSDITHFKESTKDIPQVQATLRDYQKDGYRWLAILSDYKMGGILADDMGLGKTLEIITLLKGDFEEKPSLIVCPKSLIFNWISEFEHFDPETKVVKLYGGAKERANIIHSIEKDKKVIYITGYDSLRNDIEEYENITFNYIVIDEAQAIKNVHAGKSKSVKSLNSIHKFALTGTPIENNVIDLWSIFDFIMPGYFQDLSGFKSAYEASEAYTAQIAKKVAPFILRRTKTEVLKDLPPKFERILSVDMTTSQRKVYDAYIMEARNMLESGGSAFEMLPYLMRLRQICVDPKTFIENYSDESGKMKELEAILPEYINNGHRILLFSTFVTGLGIVEEYLRNNNIEFLKLTGDTKIQDRQEYVNRFNSDTNIKVFLISLKAGGTGLNLVGADTVIHLDPWWNVSAENQATDRAYRIGQTKNVEVIKLVCEDSIEQRVIELQNLKKDIIDKIIAKDDKAITSFSLEDLSFILG